MIFNENSMPKLLEFLHIVFIFLVRFRKVPNAKYCIKTNGFSMFLGFVQFGKQSKNRTTKCKKQARKGNEKDMNKSLKNHWFSSIFMTFSGMKNALIFLCTFHGKWAPKWSQNRCQNRTVTILGGPRAARDPLWMFSGRKKTEKGCSKIDAKKWCEIWRRPGIDPCVSERPFWSRRGGKEGTSPSGSGDFGSDSASQSNTPCTRRGAADASWSKNEA